MHGAWTFLFVFYVTNKGKLQKKNQNPQSPKCKRLKKPSLNLERHRHCRARLSHVTGVQADSGQQFLKAFPNVG